MAGTMKESECGSNGDKPTETELVCPKKDECVGTWKDTSKCEDIKGKCNKDAIKSIESVARVWKCLDQNGDEALKDGKCKPNWGNFLSLALSAAGLSPDTPITAEDQEKGWKSLNGDGDKKDCSNIPQCAGRWVATTTPKCPDGCPIAESKIKNTWECKDQAGNKVALVEKKCNEKVANEDSDKTCAARKTENCLPACPLTSGTEKTLMTAAAVITAVVML